MSIKRILILLGIILGISIIGTTIFIAYKVRQSKVNEGEVVQDALAISTKKQVVLSTEFYYDQRGRVPSKLTDLFSSTSFDNSPYLPENTPGLDLIEYRYIDQKNADICLVIDSPGEQKCQRFTGK